MEILYIKSFGPISNAEVNLGKITVLLGEQGAGKSCIAKLYSLFSWLEKSIARNFLTIKYVTSYSRFQKTYAAYCNIDSYFRENTCLEFRGRHYNFLYENGSLSIDTIVNVEDSFNIPKVMYVPAERNVLGCIDHPSQIKELPKPVMTFLEEYDKAKAEQKSSYRLPFGNVAFEYDKLNDIPRLHHADYDIKLSAASSGFQSSLPLLLVSKYLTEMVRGSLSNGDLSEKERRALQKEVESIVGDMTLSDDVKRSYLRTVSSKYKYSHFVNIVEEMELNLFPESQQKMLYELVANANTLPGNKLVLTTHSPYVVNYLTLAVKAAQIAVKAQNDEAVLNKIAEIVPLNSLVNAADLYVYELDGGEVRKLADYDGIPSDENFLNVKLGDTNTAFDRLMEIEEEL